MVLRSCSGYSLETDPLNRTVKLIYDETYMYNDGDASRYTYAYPTRIYDPAGNLLSSDYYSAPDGRNALKLASHGQEFHFARFLSDDERRDFAESLSGALLAARSVRP